MVRRMVLAVIIPITTFVLGSIWGDRYAWSPKLQKKVEHHAWSNLGWLALVILGIAVIVHSIRSPHKGSSLLGLAFGIAGAVWGISVLDGVEGPTVSLTWKLLGLLAVLTVINVAMHVQKSKKPSAPVVVAPAPTTGP